MHAQEARRHVACCWHLTSQLLGARVALGHSLSPQFLGACWALCYLALCECQTRWRNSVPDVSDQIVECASLLNNPCPSQIGEPLSEELTMDEIRSHFALWAIAKSPLFISADLR